MAFAVICLATGRKFNFSKCIFNSMVRNVDSPSKFLTYLRFLQVMINNQVDDLSSHTTKYTSPALTQDVFANMRRVRKGFSGVETPLFASMLVQPHAAEEEADVEVSALEQDKIAQSLEILKLKNRVKKLERKRRSKSSGLKRLRKIGGEIKEINADEDVNLVDIKTQVDLGAELQGRKDDDNAATKDVGADEPTVFDDEEVTMTMAHTLIKIKAKKARLLDEEMAKRLHDEEVEQAAAREKQEKDDLKYQSIKRKPISIAQSRKNMIIYLKNMARYKIEHFRGMTYEKVRPIFKREYNKVQTLFIHDKDVEEPSKKRVAEETLLQESFKKLKYLNSRLKPYKSSILLLTRRFILKDQHHTGKLLELRLVKEKFSSAVPTVDKEKALWVELKNLFEPDIDDVLWKLQRRHDMFMLTEKKYPLSNGVITLMLSAKLQVKEDNDMVRDLVMKIFIEANKPKSRGLMLLGKDDSAAEEFKKLL
nr:hypothetical protein [Tanacetum cinerariifolium]